MNGLVSFRLCKLSNEELIEKVDKTLDEMYQTNKIPLRHIPARPDSDFDLLVGEMIMRFGEMVGKECKIEEPNAMPKYQDPPPPPKFPKMRGAYGPRNEDC